MSFIKALLAIAAILAVIIMLRGHAAIPEGSQSKTPTEVLVLVKSYKLVNQMKYLDLTKYSDAEKKTITSTIGQVEALQNLLTSKGFKLRPRSGSRAGFKPSNHF